MQCAITNQCYYHKSFNLQQLHKYYRFLIVIFNCLLVNLLKMRRKSGDNFLSCNILSFVHISLILFTEQCIDTVTQAFASSTMKE